MTAKSPRSPVVRQPERKSLTPAHIRQLLNYCESAKRTGYYGNRAQWEKRHGHIVVWLEQMLKDNT